ncbi:MAG TPA: HAD family hydrolase [Terriglobales bacterium]|nr:HAD family hydrolase [Terriglobales bacterium]
MTGGNKKEFICAAILFDLDGVLVNSTPAVARQWRLWARKHSILPEDVLRIAHGRRTVEVVRLLAPHLDADAESERIEKREADDVEGVTVVRGALELVSSLSDGLWAVVTSGTRYLATSRLGRHGLPIPKVLVTADDVQNGKPHPEPYLKGAQLLAVAPEECLVIEDAPAGIQSAHTSGMYVIAVSTTYPVGALSAADAIVNDLSGIRARLAEDGRKLAVVVTSQA